MIDFTNDPNSMSIPWIESPFALSYLDQKLEECPKSLKDRYYMRDLANKFISDGYIALDLELTDTEIDNIKNDILSNRDKAKTQAGHFHYSDSPRIFEAWRNSPNVLNLARNHIVLEILGWMYGRSALPFQTINFIRGSEQPGHSDSLHFYTFPERWMAACWTALEDVSKNNGTLTFYPGSHKEPHYDFHDLNLPTPKYGEEKDNYSIYENFLSDLMKVKGYEKTYFNAKAGTALIWASTLVHGGCSVSDKSLTRWSQATHYYFEGCEKYYCPLFSDTPHGIYSEKDLSKKDIMNHVI